MTQPRSTTIEPDPEIRAFLTGGRTPVPSPGFWTTLESRRIAEAEMGRHHAPGRPSATDVAVIAARSNGHNRPHRGAFMMAAAAAAVLIGVAGIVAVREADVGSLGDTGSPATDVSEPTTPAPLSFSTETLTISAELINVTADGETSSPPDDATEPPYDHTAAECECYEELLLDWTDADGRGHGVALHFATDGVDWWLERVQVDRSVDHTNTDYVSQEWIPPTGDLRAAVGQPIVGDIVAGPTELGLSDSGSISLTATGLHIATTKPTDGHEEPRPGHPDPGGTTTTTGAGTSTTGLSTTPSTVVGTSTTGMSTTTTDATTSTSSQFTTTTTAATGSTIGGSTTSVSASTTMR